MDFDDAIRDAAREICKVNTDGHEWDIDLYLMDARAAAPILMEYGRALERAAIVEWLREQWQGRLQSSMFLADTIEAGEHLSDNAEAIARGE